MCQPGLDWTGCLDWTSGLTGLDVWTGLDWSGLDWTGLWIGSGWTGLDFWLAQQAGPSPCSTAAHPQRFGGSRLAALKTRYEVMSRAADEWSIAPPSRSVPFREVSGNHRRSVAAWGHHRDKLRQASPLACDDKAWAAEQSARSSAKENAAWAASSPRSYPYP